MDSVNAAAQNFAGATSAVHASTPTAGGGTPLMALASYLLYAECALILLLSVPVYVPYRRQLLEWIHYSPRLWTLRVVIFSINAFVLVLLGDTYLRLNRLTTQIENLQAAQTFQTMPGVGLARSAGAAIAQQAATATSHVDSSGSIANLNDLFSARFRGQRDFYILAFTLFCSTVLFQLHLILIKMDKFRQQRNELRRQYGVRSSSPQRAAQKQATVTDQAAGMASNAANTVNNKAASMVNQASDITTAASTTASNVASTVTENAKQAANIATAKTSEYAGTITRGMKDASQRMADQMHNFLGKPTGVAAAPGHGVVIKQEDAAVGVAPAESGTGVTQIQQRQVYVSPVE
ncbi:hypothetical protein BC832DRAFT_537191 [Gaertneriomyces semiglobifer]|nr:hypothetical protein BC832DRAFT_537191 [Gaertneriomyces semiglobifer]